MGNGFKRIEERKADARRRADENGAARKHRNRALHARRQLAVEIACGSRLTR